MTLGEFMAWSKHSKHQQERAWERTSSLMALIANVNRSQKTRAYKPNEFNPYAKASTRYDVPTPEQIEYLKKWPGNPS